MDHFCPWVGNTVGFRNYKYFLLFLFYTVLTCWAGCFLSIGSTIRLMSAQDIAGRDINQIVFTFVAGVFAIVLTIFTGQHVWLVFNNLTTLESMDRNRLKTNAYDLGRSANWLQVFGRDTKLWALPVHTALGDGIEWEINVDESLLAPRPPSSEDEEDSPVHLSDNIV
jgi:palmitoyltransferase